jgi:hypothetical protein
MLTVWAHEFVKAMSIKSMFPQLRFGFKLKSTLRATVLALCLMHQAHMRSEVIRRRKCLSTHRAGETEATRSHVH